MHMDASTVPLKHKRKVRSGRILSHVVLSLLACFQLFPLLWLVDFSLVKTSDFMGKSILKWPSPPQWKNYEVAWIRGEIPKHFVNSFIVVGTSILLTLYIVLVLSYAFTRMEWKFRGFFFGFVLLGLMIPIHVTLLPNFLTFQTVGIRDSYFGLIIPYVAFAMPFGVFLMTNFMKSSPKEIEESAVIDGCNIWAIVFRIVMPTTAPALISITVTTFLSCWNEFIMAATYLTSEQFRTLPFSVRNFVGAFSSDYAVQFAVMTLTSIPALLVYIIFNRQMTKGIVFGAVKG